MARSGKTKLAAVNSRFHWFTDMIRMVSFTAVFVVSPCHANMSTAWRPNETCGTRSFYNRTIKSSAYRNVDSKPPVGWFLCSEMVLAVDTWHSHTLVHLLWQKKYISHDSFKEKHTWKQDSHPTLPFSSYPWKFVNISCQHSLIHINFFILNNRPL